MNPSDDPDLPLLQGVASGDESALGELIGRHQQALFYFVYRYLGDETRAREITHETFVRVYFKASGFRPRSRVKTWIYAIALNLCRDAMRRQKRKPVTVSLDELRQDESEPREVADSALTPDERLLGKENLSRLRSYIDRLPRKLKVALVLFVLEGRSQKEVAEMLQTTPKTVELRVYHAKKKLQAYLESAGD